MSVRGVDTAHPPYIRASSVALPRRVHFLLISVQKPLDIRLRWLETLVRCLVEFRALAQRF